MHLRSGVLAVLACALFGCSEDGEPNSPSRAPVPGFNSQGAPPAPVSWPSYTVIGRRTDPGSLKWRIDPTGCPVDADRFRDEVIRAMNVWQDTGLVRFTEATPPREPDLVLSWHGKEHEGCRFIEWDGGVAHAAADGPTLAVIHFNTEVDWARRSLFCAALHELGHILGLGHSPVAEAVMYGGYDDTHVALTGHDLAGLHTIYGGGEDHPSDLAIVHFEADGTPKRAAPSLRRVVPQSCRFAVLDADGSGSADVLVWRGDRTPGPMMRYSFMANARVDKSVGPLVGITRKDRDTWIGKAESGGAVMVDVLADGRYVASAFNDKGLPADPWPEGPLVLDNGLADRNGDGVLEQRTPLPPRTSDQHEILARADVDRDGHADVLVVAGTEGGSRRMQWLLTAGDPNGSTEGASFLAGAIGIGDLDGDDRPEGVVRGLVKPR